MGKARQADALRFASLGQMSRFSLLLLAIVAHASEIKLVTFDGASGTTHKFQELNDPVMGGKSTGTWATDGTHGVFNGQVVDVPALNAPGFIKAAADGSFPDASGAIGGAVLLSVRSSTPEYQGFRITIASGAAAPSYSCAGGGGIPFSRGCFKAKYSVAAGDGFTTVRIPMTEFSDLWSSATGEHTKDCTEDKSACLTAAKLKKIQRVELWAEGKAGNVHLEIESIGVEASEQVQLLDDHSVTYLATFDGANGTDFTWRDQNDPVMGGASTSSFMVKEDASGKYGVFNGTCAIVGYLKAPGFAKITTESEALNDASAHITGGLQLRVRSSTPEYAGFRLGFGAKNVPKTSVFGGSSFKAGFQINGTDWQLVSVPFNLFSYDWSGYTGGCDTKDPGIFGRQHYCCTPEHQEVCPTSEFLSTMTDVEVWAEGVEGDFHIELQWIRAVN